MLHSGQLLARKAPLRQIWSTGNIHAKIHCRKLEKLNIFQNCEEVLNPSVPMALPLSLRLSGILMDVVARLRVDIKEAWKVKSAPLDPSRLPKGTKFDVEEDKVMQWRNFTRPEHISIIRPIHLLVHIPSLDRHSFPLAPLSHQSRRLSTIPPLEDTEVTDAGNNLVDNLMPAPTTQQWTPPLLPSSFPEKHTDGNRKRVLDAIRIMFLCAHHCKSEEAPNLLSVNLVETTSGEKAIYHALELHPTKLLVVSDSEYFCTRMKSCLLKGCYPKMPGHKRGHEEVDDLKKLKSHEAICRILDKLPVGILIKVEHIISEENRLAHILAALGLQGQGVGKFHNSIEEVRAEYNRRREEIEKMPAGELKKEEELRLPPLTDTAWNNMKAAIEIPTATEANFIRWMGIKGRK